MTRDTVWQDDPPFAVGEAAKVEPAPDWLSTLVNALERDHLNIAEQIVRNYPAEVLARIKAEREQTIRELRDNYKCGEEYEAGLWSRRNIEAFFRDQDKET